MTRYTLTVWAACDVDEVQWKPGTWDKDACTLTFTENYPSPDDDNTTLCVKMKCVGSEQNEHSFAGTSVYDERYVKQIVHLGLPSGTQYTITKSLIQRQS